MQVGHNDAPDVDRANSERPELRPCFLLRLDVEAHSEAEIGMPAREAVEACGSARIDENDAVAMLDCVGQSRRPARPFFVE
jgi:hypothetical protein